MASAADENFFRSKYTTTISFAVAVLLFLLPFVEVKCNDESLVQNSGLGLAFGNDFELVDKMKSLRDSVNNGASNKGGPSKDSGKVYYFALAALLLGITGIILSVTKIRSGIINTVIGVAAALSLVGLMFHLNHDIDKTTGERINDLSGSFKSFKVSLSFTIWYYLSLVCFLAAAFFSFKRGQLLITNSPPSNAPQLDLNNPGEQSEFPKSASESEIG